MGLFRRYLVTNQDVGKTFDLTMALLETSPTFTMHPERNMNISKRFHGNPSDEDISLKTTNVKLVALVS